MQGPDGSSSSGGVGGACGDAVAAAAVAAAAATDAAPLPPPKPSTSGRGAGAEATTTNSNNHNNNSSGGGGGGAFVPVELVAARLRAIDDPVLRAKVAKALHMLRRTLELYSSAHVSLSFNGGKDSTVLLHLMRVALHPELDLSPLPGVGLPPRLSGSGGSGTFVTSPPGAAQQQQQQQLRKSSGGTSSGGVGLPASMAAAANPGSGTSAAARAAADATVDLNALSEDQGLGSVAVFYFERPDDFEDVRQFVRETDAAYRLGTRFLSHPDFKLGLEEYLQEVGTAAIVLGTRRGDPNAEGQEYFCPSSAGWPPFMRVNPVLDWSYADVWGFLRACGLPYCRLYDQGYTSLGGVHNTLPNSALKKADGSFAPAYILADGRLERAGRATKQRRGDSLASGPGGVAAAMTWVAGVVVVGDEMLSGKVVDSNVPFLCAKLHELGWSVRKVAFVPDDVAAIASEVAALAASCQAVLTSGGVGPTLDDVTMAGVAAAFGVDVARHPDLEESLLRYFGHEHATPAHLKLADVPDDDTTRLLPTRLDNGRPSPFPLVAVRNVFILPGVPHLLRQKWPAIARELAAAAALAPFSNRVARLRSEDEALVAPLLDTLAAEWGGEVAIGSYPITDPQPDGARLLVTLESKAGAARLDAALRRLRELLSVQGALGPGALLSVQRDVSSLAVPGGGGGGGSVALQSPVKQTAAAPTAAAAAENEENEGGGKAVEQGS